MQQKQRHPVVVAVAVLTVVLLAGAVAAVSQVKPPSREITKELDAKAFLNTGP